MISATRVVEVEFDSGVWTSLTSKARSAVIHRGRSNELERFSVGRLDLVLDNRDRRFDPRHSAGPYYGKLEPKKRVRVGLTYAATTYWRFYGEIEGWPQSYSPTQRDATVTIRAHDAFKKFGRAHIPSPWEQAVREDAPDVWYRMDEIVGQTAAVDSSGNGNHGTHENGGPANSTGGLVYGDPSRSIEFKSEQRIVAPDNLITAFPFTLEWVIQPSDSDRETVRYLFRQAVENVASVAAQERVFVYIADENDTGFEGTLNFGMGKTNANREWMATSAAIDDGAPHHVVCKAVDASTFEIWVDGVQADQDRGAFGTLTLPMSSTADVAVGNTAGLGLGDLPANTPIDEFVFYDGELSDARIAEHADAALAPWAGDTPKARIDRILDYLGWPAGDRDIDTGSAVLSSARLDRGALAHLQEVDVTEGGRLFMSRTGKVTLVGRQNSWTEAAYATSQATLSDAPSAGEVRYTARPGELFTYDDESIITEARVRMDDGGEQIATSGSTELVTRSESTLDSRPELALSRANYLISVYASPRHRTPRIVIDPERDASVIYPVVLGSELGYRYTVENTPMGVGSAIAQEVHLEGIVETITPDRYTVEWGLSPAEPAFWVLGTSELGTETIPAY